MGGSRVTQFADESQQTRKALPSNNSYSAEPPYTSQLAGGAFRLLVTIAIKPGYGHRLPAFGLFALAFLNRNRNPPATLEWREGEGLRVGLRLRQAGDPDNVSCTQLHPISTMRVAHDLKLA